MKTDSIFYRLFETSPETFFLLLGMSAEAAAATAARYCYQAIEFKETSHRTDGVFQPREPGLPVYISEVQFYPAPAAYADLLVKAYTFLKQNDPSQSFCGVVLFATRAMEPTGLAPYQPLLDSGHLRRIYLDEIPELVELPLGLAIVDLIRRDEEQSPMAARTLVARAKGEIEDASLRSKLVELIETVVIYKLPRLSREEIQAMLQVHDIRETRVYQEAKEEGFQEGIEKGIEKGVEKERQRAIAALAAQKMPPAKIAVALSLDLDLVEKTLAKKPKPRR